MYEELKRKQILKEIVQKPSNSYIHDNDAFQIIRDQIGSHYHGVLKGMAC